MAMTLRQLQYLVTIVETGSFTRAAEQLHVSQPALSRQLQILERSCGGPLIERGGRPIIPTPLGRAILPHARAALVEVDKAHAAALCVVNACGGELRLATLHSISLGVLPTVLGAWRREHPDVRISLTEKLHDNELQLALGAGQADVAIGPPPIDWPGSLFPLEAEEFVVVLSAEDPLTRRSGSRLHLSELAGREWVHFTEPNGLSKIFDHACESAGFRPRIAARTQQTASALQLALVGVGPTLLPANMIPAHLVARVLLPDPPVRRPLAAYTRSRPDALTAAFIDVLTEHARPVPAHIASLAGISAHRPASPPLP
ncbi:LysR family transcriptional regulator [Streptomyces sp. NPDC093097]|uniref:LysR family transcriptional regulator n=1 Tax=Streptomyces sp. NPDC093097 TaxID=3366027 RepID=UPI0038064BD5